MARCCSIMWCFLAASVFIFDSQQHAVAAENVIFASQCEPRERFGFSDAVDIVSCGIMDQKGSLWFGTADRGVYRYDGDDFQKFTTHDGLSSDSVWAILEDKTGVLWFGTDNGLCTFDGTAFTHFSIPAGAERSPRILCLLQDQKGNIWMGTDGNGAYRFDGKRFTNFLENEGRIQADGKHWNVIQSMTQDGQGNVWFTSMTHGGVSRYDGNSMDHFTTKNGLSDDMIPSSLCDKQGRLWFGTRDNGICRFDGKSFSHFREIDGLIDNCVSSIYQDRQGMFWVGGGRRGMCRFDGKTFVDFRAENDTVFEDTRFFVEDRSGDLWFGGRYGVLVHFDGETLVDYSQQLQ